MLDGCGCRPDMILRLGELLLSLGLNMYVEMLISLGPVPLAIKILPSPKTMAFVSTRPDAEMSNTPCVVMGGSLADAYRRYASDSRGQLGYGTTRGSNCLP
ncbi:hypothetical protein AMAG_20133 [Allomyces macrogynus ATCC 38327]|uniref:Uncharacterized protein n=1 Tax=Allomyces macrogynus (strain ATCC 38327) TaxID=578462 RepID=A0A0L0T571_ALLM3|nr:hypothetical protein AMAG_20133 [Allomyces macrogynus ATCC 38327]|eukprot:KNE69895.1 hypothetical protein AMAG_20133 [Allomyces macrogynus ATCC 38327]